MGDPTVLLPTSSDALSRSAVPPPANGRRLPDAVDEHVSRAIATEVGVLGAVFARPRLVHEAPRRVRTLPSWRGLQGSENGFAARLAILGRAAAHRVGRGCRSGQVEEVVQLAEEIEGSRGKVGVSCGEQIVHLPTSWRRVHPRQTRWIPSRAPSGRVEPSHGDAKSVRSRRRAFIKRAADEQQDAATEERRAKNRVLKLRQARRRGSGSSTMDLNGR